MPGEVSITYKALLVGNSIFHADPNNLQELKGPPNDLRVIEETLTHPAIGLFLKENVEVLFNRNKQEIEERIESFFGDADLDDQLLFYFTGHGELDKYDRFYFCASDTKTSSLISTAISDQTVNFMLENSIAKRIVIIIDACNSGKFKGGLSIPKNLAGTGRFILTSSRAKVLTEDSKDRSEPSPFTRYVVDSLLKQEVDTNNDGYISLKEIYNYASSRLLREYNIQPQYTFDKAIGDVVLGKCVREAVTDIPHVTDDPFHVSESIINIKDVRAGEVLPREKIFVTHSGAGKPEWNVETEDTWIGIEKGEGYFYLLLKPSSPGVNRGNIYVNDPNSGSSQKIQVLVDVIDDQKPELVLSDTDISFGKITRNTRASSLSVRVYNKGGGTLKYKPINTYSWFDIKKIGDILEVIPNTEKTGSFEGEIKVISNGGEGRIRISATIEDGPVLSVDPVSLNLGKIKSGTNIEKQIRITNSGKGELDWQYYCNGDFYTVTRNKNRLTFQAVVKPGKYHGSIVIKSNGGDITVDVRLNGEIQIPITDITGSWGNDAGVLVLTHSNQTNHYYFQDYNLLGINVGNGEASVKGDAVELKGYNIMSGSYTGILKLHGSNTMQGTLSGFGFNSPIALNKLNNTVNPFQIM